MDKKIENEGSTASCLLFSSGILLVAAKNPSHTATEAATVSRRTEQGKILPGCRKTTRTRPWAFWVPFFDNFVERDYYARGNVA